ncbi:MAG TPA: hypothetical protein VF175_12045 [Lacipirellula sp.]
MAKRKTKPRRPSKPAAQPPRRYSEETRAGDATTVAWVVSVIMVLLCDIGAAAAHWWSRDYANSGGIALFKELLLFAGAAIGFVSLALLPIMLKVRRVPPPTGILVFAVCVAAAPMVAILAQNLR